MSAKQRTLFVGSLRLEVLTRVLERGLGTAGFYAPEFRTGNEWNCRPAALRPCAMITLKAAATWQPSSRLERMHAHAAVLMGEEDHGYEREHACALARARLPVATAL